jgi:hypothetical protein
VNEPVLVTVRYAAPSPPFAGNPVKLYAPANVPFEPTAPNNRSLAFAVVSAGLTPTTFVEVLEPTRDPFCGDTGAMPANS